MKTLATTGKVLFAIPMIVFGLFHFINAKGMAGMVPTYFPSQVMMVYITGLGLVLAGISIIVNVMTKIACLLLALMLLIFILTIHVPGLMDAGSQQMATISLLKDMALMGAALAFAAKK